MNKETKEELSKMQSLMERMNKHYTKTEAEENKTKFLNEALEETGRDSVYTHDNLAYNLSSPEELIQALTTDGISPKKSWFVTLGYIKGFKELGKKKISSSIEKYGDDEINVIRNMDSPRLNDILNNPQTVEKGRNKGKIINPYMPDSYSNFIVEASIIRLMYGRNDEYFKQKDATKRELAQYQNDNPDDVKHYMTSKGLMDFVDQSYDDARADTTTHVPGTNVFQKQNGAYEMRFNTPKGVFQKLKTQYFLITDEDTVEPISKEEAEAYANLYGVVSAKKEETDEIIAKVKKDIDEIKARNHKGDIWGRYDLDGVFFMNFSEGNDSKKKLQYYNPNAIVEFVKGRELKSGTVPSRRLTNGVMKPHFDKIIN